MRDFYTLKNLDVGQPTIRAFGRIWQTADCIGRVLPTDVGRRVYKSADGIQVESDDQRIARTTNYEHVELDERPAYLLRFDVTPETEGKPIQIAYGGPQFGEKYGPGAPYKRAQNVVTGETTYFQRKDKP
jgi:hypothetical protein